VQIRTTKRVAVLAAVFVALAVSTSLATSNGLSNGTNPVFSTGGAGYEGVPRLYPVGGDFQDPGLTAGHINAGLNESFAERDVESECYLAYCGEYGVDAYAGGWADYVLAGPGDVNGSDRHTEIHGVNR